VFWGWGDWRDGGRRAPPGGGDGRGGQVATDFERDFLVSALAGPAEAAGAAVFGLRFSSPCDGMKQDSLALAPPASSPVG
jgi:hypothetical protein